MTLAPLAHACARIALAAAAAALLTLGCAAEVDVDGSAQLIAPLSSAPPNASEGSSASKKGSVSAPAEPPAPGGDNAEPHPAPWFAADDDNAEPHPAPWFVPGDDNADPHPAPSTTRIATGDSALPAPK
jgi:hypothetical protein